jgi:hypothetical protein
MTPVTLIRSLGATPKIDDSGRLTLDLSRVPQDQRPEVVALAKQHKDALVRELTAKTHKTPLLIPKQLEISLLNCGYAIPDWTPEGCRRFLEQLRAEWQGFHVNGWHGCEFPACWPVTLQDAVTSIYVMSIQDQGGGA